MTDFDHKRIAEAYAFFQRHGAPFELGAKPSMMKFTYLVMDYMTHLQEMPDSNSQEQLRQEELSVDRFIELIDTDAAWPIAKQYMTADFTNDLDSNFSSNNQYLESIRSALESRLSVPKAQDRLQQLPQWEAQELLTRLEKYVSFIASLAESEVKDIEERKKMMIQKTREVFPVKNLPKQNAPKQNAPKRNAPKQNTQWHATGARKSKVEESDVKRVRCGSSTEWVNHTPAWLRTIFECEEEVRRSPEDV